MFLRFCFEILKITSLLRSSCNTLECRRTENFLKMSMSSDKTKICDSFYDYVCENFKTHFPLKPNQKRLSMSTIRQKEIDRILIDVLDGSEEGIEALGKARRYYKSCMNEESKDLSPLKEALLKVGLDLRPPFDLTASKELDISSPLWNIRRISLSDFLIKLGVRQGTRKTNKYLPFVDNTPVVSTHVYQKDESARNALANYILNTISYVYRETATSPAVDKEIISQRIQDVIDFLTKVRETQEMDNLIDETATYHSLNYLQSKTDEILKGKKIRLNWSNLITNLVGEDMMTYFNNGEDIIVSSEEQLMKIIKIISETKPETFDAALWWVVVEDFISLVGTKEVRKFEMEYEQAVSIYDSSPRSELCVKAIRLRFSHVVGYILATREDSLPNIENIINTTQRLILELPPLIEGSSWLTRDSKNKLFQKIQELRVITSFTDNVADPRRVNAAYTGMEFDEHDYYSNRMQFANQRIHVQRVYLKRSLQSFSRQSTSAPPPQSSQNIFHLPQAPTNVTPMYTPLTNVIDIPIGFLGFPYYDLGLHSLDFGSAATIIAHELTHMIDTKTQRYDASGNTVEDWRTEDESNEYDRRAQCFAKSFTEFYSGDINQRPNYANLLREHVADFVGFEMTLKAYRKVADEIGVGKKLRKFNFDHLQLFTIAFAMRECENSTPEELEWQKQYSSHPPARFRANAVLRNTEDFGQIWNCQPGTKMNPVKKCKLWTD